MAPLRTTPCANSRLSTPRFNAHDAFFKPKSLICTQIHPNKLRCFQKSKHPAKLGFQKKSSPRASPLRVEKGGASCAKSTSGGGCASPYTPWGSKREREREKAVPAAAAAASARPYHQWRFCFPSVRDKRATRATVGATFQPRFKPDKSALYPAEGKVRREVQFPGAPGGRRKQARKLSAGRRSRV